MNFFISSKTILSLKYIDFKSFCRFNISVLSQFLKTTTAERATRVYKFGRTWRALIISCPGQGWRSAPRDLSLCQQRPRARCSFSRSNHSLFCTGLRAKIFKTYVLREFRILYSFIHTERARESECVCVDTWHLIICRCWANTRLYLHRLCALALHLARPKRHIWCAYADQE